MSTRHFFESPNALVNKALRGIVSYNPSLGLDESNRVVFNSTFDRSHVAIISGGGSGHEPAWSGYVGRNMLAASVAGDIFASPSTKQILAAIDRTPSNQGTILVVINYTGDCLHFGLAKEKALASGHHCRMIICGDDVSIGKRDSFVGRRGLAGQLGVIKVMGGAAGTGASLDQTYDLGIAFAEQIVSIAATLDHCHVPGRKEHNTLSRSEAEIGTGPHNEPGHKKISPAPSAPDLIRQLLLPCLDRSDPDRGYVQFRAGDEVVLLVNNFGGVSYLEMGALVDEILEQLDRDWSIAPVRVYTGPLETSLNAVAFSVSLINVTAAAANCSYSADEIKAFLDLSTNTHWESLAGFSSQRRARTSQFTAAPQERRDQIDGSRDVQVDPVLLERMLRRACESIIAAEPDLTRWDMIMGDGDCGETFKTGATSLVQALDSTLAGNGSVLAVLHELEAIVENKMGGTLGGILAIFFVSLRRAVEQNSHLAPAEGIPRVWSRALDAALESVRKYTPAKVGDRTVMDTLIPFAQAMGSGDFDSAVEVARQGAEATKTMAPRLGRATYVRVSSHEELPPDPGAWGIMAAIQGLQDGMQRG